MSHVLISCQVGSRLVLQTTGILMIVLGIFGKFGAVFITIPDPVIGGMFLVMFGMIAAVGISNLQVNTFQHCNISYFIILFGEHVYPKHLLSGAPRPPSPQEKTEDSCMDQFINH